MKSDLVDYWIFKMGRTDKLQVWDLNLEIN